MNAPSSRSVHIIRTASVRDTRQVRQLDEECFPPGDRDREPAPPGELEAAVLDGDVRVVEIDGHVVAYVHVDRHTRADQVYISGIGVVPWARRRGLGTRLIDDCLSSVDDDFRALVPIVTITSPRNRLMLRIIHGRGFRARWYLPDYFGPGRDRLGCQLNISGRTITGDGILRIPFGDHVALGRLLSSGAHVIQSVNESYELIAYRGADFPPCEAPHA
jgi:ribosomal protein S18 acetylase RimI-like enzyme